MDKVSGEQAPRTTASLLFHLEIDSEGRLVGWSRVIAPSHSTIDQRVVHLAGQRAFLGALLELIGELTDGSPGVESHHSEC
jgi:hypothetical protein